MRIGYFEDGVDSCSHFVCLSNAASALQAGNTYLVIQHALSRSIAIRFKLLMNWPG